MNKLPENQKSIPIRDIVILTGIKDGSIREIPLTQGKIAIVDVKDYEWLNQWKWYAHKKNDDSTYYARRRGTLSNGKRITVFMHREILTLTYRDGRIPDHKDHNGLNNRRDNLRIVSPSLNRHNSKLLRNNTSGYRGVDPVTYIKKNGTRNWRVRISFEGKRMSGKSYSNILDAAAAYDLIAIKLWGPNIPLNLPERRNEYVSEYL